MRNGIIIVLILIIGILIGRYVWNAKNEKNENYSSRVIAYELEKMNKLIVVERNYSDIFTHKNSNTVLMDLIEFDKTLVLMVEAKVQATYDMSKMNIELDSVRERIIIKSIPEPEIRIFPQARFHDIDQSVFNKYEKDELNTIQQKAIDDLKKNINEDEIKAEAHGQLIKNLNDIYGLAKIYGWKIVDKTGKIKIPDKT